eukprot:TRINITY_DN684_c0_g1_i3.p1 TRINITY_DN684_c0_g1~~TRINITY_DN684_c0_g1_i3.p1  ORF type:complete len:334 (-),score=93.35 TRINITY_DN684_c0_g1_i3:166-1167(-)
MGIFRPTSAKMDVRIGAAADATNERVSCRAEAEADAYLNAEITYDLDFDRGNQPDVHASVLAKAREHIHADCKIVKCEEGSSKFQGGTGFTVLVTARANDMVKTKMNNMVEQMGEMKETASKEAADRDATISQLMKALKQARSKAAEREDELQREIDGLRARLNHDEDALDGERSVIEAKNEQIAQLNETIRVLDKERALVVTGMNTKLSEGMAAMQAQQARARKEIAQRDKEIARQRGVIEERDDTIDTGKDLLESKREQVEQLKRHLALGQKMYDVNEEENAEKVNQIVNALRAAREEAKRKLAEKEAEIARLRTDVEERDDLNRTRTKDE